MEKSANGIDLQVHNRLEYIAKSRSRKIRTLHILDEVFSRRYTVVYNAFQEVEGSGEMREIFVEIGRQVTGCYNLAKIMSLAGEIKGLPDYYFPIKCKKVVIGFAYQKFCDVVPYVNFLNIHREEISYFLSNLGDLIARVHAKGLLLPPAWTESQLLYADKDYLPVIIGYNGIRLCQNSLQFNYGCLEDWSALRRLIFKWKAIAPSVSCSRIRGLEAYVKSKIEEAAVT